MSLTKKTVTKKTKKTIAKRLIVRKSGLVTRTVAGHQHLRHRKSRRSLHTAKVGMKPVSAKDLKELGVR